MKKEFSFYEFVGVIVPSVVLLYFLNAIFLEVYQKSFVDFAKVGDTAAFFIMSYGLGHLIHALGNILENIVWWLLGGMPSRWLIKGNRFKRKLLHESEEEKIKEKLYVQFGEADKDYGRLVYNVLYQKGKTSRIDIFNGNYSLFRGLMISFLLLTIFSWYYLSFQVSLVALAMAVLAFIRMVLFAKLYAKELFITYLNFQET